MVRGKGILTFVLGLSVCFAADAQTAKKPAVPLWQVPPFDRVHLVDGNHHDVDPIRIPADAQIPVRANEYIGRLGLPMMRPEGEQRAAIYRVRKVDDGMSYELIGRSIASVEYFEEMLLEQANRLIDLRQFDEAVDYLRTLDALDSEWDSKKRSNWREGTNCNYHLYNLLETRIRFHRAEAAVQADTGKLERAFWSLVEEKQLLEKLRAESQEPVDDEQLTRRFDHVIDRWMKRLLEIEKDYRSGRRVIARMESVFPQSAVAAKWRAEYARQAARVLRAAATAQQAGRMRDAFDELERAAAIDPGAANVRSAIETFYKKYAVLKVAVARLSIYASGPAEWSPDDWRCSDLIHLPIMWLKSMENGGTFESELIGQPERENINQRGDDYAPCERIALAGRQQGRDRDRPGASACRRLPGLQPAVSSGAGASGARNGHTLANTDARRFQATAVPARCLAATTLLPTQP